MLERKVILPADVSLKKEISLQEAIALAMCCKFPDGTDIPTKKKIIGGHQDAEALETDENISETLADFFSNIDHSPATPEQIMEKWNVLVQKSKKNVSELVDLLIKDDDSQEKSSDRIIIDGLYQKGFDDNLSKDERIEALGTLISFIKNIEQENNDALDAMDYPKLWSARAMLDTLKTGNDNSAFLNETSSIVKQIKSPQRVQMPRNPQEN